MTMDDKAIQAEIERLTSEEHALFERRGSMSEGERKRLAEITVELDRMWDLLRQRRAREEFALDPETATERSAATVERYLQ